MKRTFKRKGREVRQEGKKVNKLICKISNERTKRNYNKGIEGKINKLK